MNMLQAEEGLIGISLRHDQLRMTEAAQDPESKEFKIRAASVGTATQPLSHEAIQNKSAVKGFSEDISRMYEAAGFKSTKASLSIDSDLVLIKKIPTDSSLEGEDLRQHIKWEVRQLMINPLDQFIIDFEPLEAPEGGGQEKDVVIVSIRRQVVDFMREIFAGTDLQLQAIDVDVFAAQRVITEAFTHSPEDKLAMIDIRRDNMQFSIIHKGFFTTQELSYPADEALEVGENREAQIARIISKELRRIILDNKLGKSIEDMQQIFVYGDNAAEGILETLSQAHNVNLSLLNPFEKIPLITEEPDAEVTKHPESFVTSVGAAIKGF